MVPTSVRWSAQQVASCSFTYGCFGQDLSCVFTTPAILHVWLLSIPAPFAGQQDSPATPWLQAPLLRLGRLGELTVLGHLPCLRPPPTVPPACQLPSPSCPAAPPCRPTRLPWPTMPLLRPAPPPSGLWVWLCLHPRPLCPVMRVPVGQTSGELPW